MIKRVNFTGRKRVARQHVKIELLDGAPRSFNAQVDLNGTQFPPGAAVFLEATCAGSNRVLRFPAGATGDDMLAAHGELTGLESNRIIFSLKIVDQTQRFGRLLGVSDGIQVERSGDDTISGRRGILAIEPSDSLGHRLWALEFKDQYVSLLVNRDVPELTERAGSDPLFYAIVFPEAMRQVLHKAIDENRSSQEDDDDHWAVAWLKFGRDLHPMRESSPEKDDNDAREEWIADVVEAFCQKHDLKTRYREAVAALNGGES